MSRENSKNFTYAFCKSGALHACTPMSISVKISADLTGKQVDPTVYRCMIGSLLYLTAS
jgi:hypothetical protein